MSATNQVKSPIRTTARTTLFFRFVNSSCWLDFRFNLFSKLDNGSITRGFDTTGSILIYTCQQ
jgi:hypothetical protein